MLFLWSTMTSDNTTTTKTKGVEGLQRPTETLAGHRPGQPSAINDTERERRPQSRGACRTPATAINSKYRLQLRSLISIGRIRWNHGDATRMKTSLTESSSSTMKPRTTRIRGKKKIQYSFTALKLWMSFKRWKEQDVPEVTWANHIFV